MKKEVKELVRNDDDLWCEKGTTKPFTGSHTFYQDDSDSGKEANFIDGKLDGKVTDWHENGQRWHEDTFKNGLKHGRVIEWYECGQKRLEVFYENNKAEGLCTYWHKNGSKQKEGHYKDGEEDGVWVFWDENGEKEHEEVYREGEVIERDGDTVSYFDNLINLYLTMYVKKQFQWYLHYKSDFDDESSYESIKEMCGYPSDTYIVDTGDVPYLVLRPNQDPIALSPYYDLCDESMDQSYSGAIMSTLAFVEGMDLVRYLPGVDSFKYPELDDISSLNSSYEYRYAYRIYDLTLPKLESMFKDLELDDEKRYVLGRKLLLAVLSLSNMVDSIASNEDVVDDDGEEILTEDLLARSEILEIFTLVAVEKTIEIYEWAASEGDEEEDDTGYIDDFVEENDSEANEKHNDLSPLWLALMTKNNDHFIELIHSGSDVNEMADPTGIGVHFSLLHIVAEQFDTEVLQLLIDAGADIEARMTNGETPLTWSLKGENLDNFNVLLSAGANPDPELIVDNNYNIRAHGPGFSPLRMAATHGLCDAVEKLIGLGANVDAVDFSGGTALKNAIGNKNCLKMLLKFGANPDLSDLEGFAPIHNAVDESDYAAVKLLIKYGADVNKVIISESGDTEEDGDTPLRRACYQDVDYSMIKLLVKKGGADVDFHGDNKNPPLLRLFETAMVEYDDDFLRAIEIFKKKNANFSLLDSDGLSLLILSTLYMVDDDYEPISPDVFAIVLEQVKDSLDDNLVLNGENISLEDLLGNIEDEERRSDFMSVADEILGNGICNEDEYEDDYEDEEKLIVEYFENGNKKSEGYKVSGVKQNDWMYWYENGKVRLEEYFNEEGILDGPFTSYYESGLEKIQGFYDNGIKSGTWYYTEDNDDLDNLIRSEEYEDGNLISFEEY